MLQVLTVVLASFFGGDDDGWIVVPFESITLDVKDNVLTVKGTSLGEWEHYMEAYSGEEQDYTRIVVMGRPARGNHLEEEEWEVKQSLDLWVARPPQHIIDRLEDNPGFRIPPPKAVSVWGKKGIEVIGYNEYQYRIERKQRFKDGLEQPREVRP